MSGTAQTTDYRLIPNNTHKWWFLDPCLRWNMLHCMGLCGAMFFNGYDGSLFNGLQSISEWTEYFNHPSSTILGLMNSAGFLPGCLASFFGDAMQHFFGKRTTVWVSSVIALVGVIVISVSTSVGMFCGGRAIMGFGTSAALAVAPAHLQEIAHPRYRAPVSAFFTAIYYLAAIISSAVCLGCLGIVGEMAWRIPAWLQVCGPSVTLILTATMPESPRWLVRNRRLEDARKVLVKYHANGLEDDPLVDYEFREICAAIEEEQNAKQIKYTDFLRTPGNRHRLMILIVQGISMNWVGNGIISYYLSPILTSLGITSTREQLTILTCLHVWNLIIATSASVFIDKAGRRPLWLSATAGQLLSLVAVMGLSAAYSHGVEKAGVAVIPFFFIFYGSYDIAYSPMSYSYPVEILTFSMRTKGAAIYITISTLAVALNTWVNPIALAALAWKYYGVYIAINAVLIVIIYLGFPETKNRTIEEVAIIFDGDRAIAEAYNASGENGDARSSSIEIREESEAKE
ncbi:uncharacterized protein N7496_002275 [Penicillium cataractarum]|uniref:Major facilitator superfamily (MFS) profile domain-containing protein n=1 Tax=Penicillium cataractarum TaxID=2100454 RepID=A0A9W9SKG5_9EURO|nr:uncharacterized protein N7496_002275 [Penicillium cataractarum]KAJ5379847.1 hypothetical protein N7496_002275 [Penicillium cataractarum]